MGVKNSYNYLCPLAFYITLWQNSLRLHQNGEQLFISKTILVPTVERKAKPFLRESVRDFFSEAYTEIKLFCVKRTTTTTKTYPSILYSSLHDIYFSKSFKEYVAVLLMSHVDPAQNSFICREAIKVLE